MASVGRAFWSSSSGGKPPPGPSPTNRKLCAPHAREQLGQITCYVLHSGVRRRILQFLPSQERRVVSCCHQCCWTDTRTQADRQTDRQTDGQTNGRKETTTLTVLNEEFDDGSFAHRQSTHHGRLTVLGRHVYCSPALHHTEHFTSKLGGRQPTYLSKSPTHSRHFAQMG